MEIFTLSVPAFNSLKELHFPIWSEYRDVFRYAKVASLYFRIAQKTGATHTTEDKSLMFLNRIKEPEYMGIVSALKTDVRRYVEVQTSRAMSHPFADAPEELFPEELKIEGLAANIYVTMSGFSEDGDLEQRARVN